MEEFTEDFLRFAFVRCSRCGKELPYQPILPRNCVFLHLSEEDGKLHFIKPGLVEPYCLDCMWEIQRGEVKADET